MLISFKVGNFCSFDEIQIFSMEAGLVRKKADRIYKGSNNTRLVKFAALFGANASGKSMFVEAISFSQSTILSKLPSEIGRLYCRTTEENRTKPTYFEYRIIIAHREFEYSFSCNLDERRIETEKLVEIKKNKKNILYFRDVNTQTFTEFNFKDKQLNTKLNLYASDIRNEQEVLFLTILNQNKSALYAEHEEALPFKEIYEWFGSSLSVNYPDIMISPYSYFLSNENKNQVCKILSSYDTGITDYSIVENTNEMVKSQIPDDVYKAILAELMKAKKKGLPPSIVLRGGSDLLFIQLDDNENIVSQTVQFCHVGSNSRFGMGEESDGTIRLMDLLTILFDQIKEKIYIIDEIDRCLHPQLTAKFVEDFLYLAKQRNTQLIVTTHESSLLDFDILRKDEIWFVNKENGTSKMYPLESFPDQRFDKKIEIAYKEGTYKAKPNFKDIYPLLESLPDVWTTDIGKDD